MIFAGGGTFYLGKIKIQREINVSDECNTGQYMILWSANIKQRFGWRSGWPGMALPGNDSGTELRSENEEEFVRQVGSEVPSRRGEQRVPGGRRKGWVWKSGRKPVLWKSRKRDGLRGSWKNRQKPDNVGSSRSWNRALSLSKELKGLAERYDISVLVFLKDHSGYSIKNWLDEGPGVCTDPGEAIAENPGERC